MSKNGELDHQYKRGADDFRSGENHPPSDNILNYVKPLNDATVEEKDSAYNAGRSDEGAKKK